MQTSAKIAMIVGANGQDGKLLQKSLLAKGFTVVGLTRQEVHLHVDTHSSCIGSFDLSNRDQVSDLIAEHSPTEIYYLAAHHGSSEAVDSQIDPQDYELHHRVHVSGLMNFLAAMANHSKNSRLFYASSSLIFDGSNGPKQSEQTPYTPLGYYGLTKVQGMYLCKEFRSQHGIFAASGILYNHESVLRPKGFLSKKIVAAAYDIHRGNQSQLVLGNLDARTDWGYAPDYVEAFQKILRTGQADDFVIASGESHTVKEFADLAFQYFDLDAAEYIREDKSLLKRRTHQKIGDFTHLKTATGWQPSLDFRNMVQQLVRDYVALAEAGSEKRATRN